ncbi:sorting nexin-16 isoform X2 [Protopterus annectens]|nr:sorting nexin-16 isoform X2 [Protopterus annectens]
MAATFVPLPVPLGNDSPNSNRSRTRRSSSFGSMSTNSSSSKGQPEDLSTGICTASVVAEHVSPTSVCSSPRIQTKLNGVNPSIQYNIGPEMAVQDMEASNWEERPATPTILGYEVMEERAKFTVYKILVRKVPHESWVVFRRYTDFSRLNEKLKEMFPGFRLALPPKRWFKDNYNPDFLEDRLLGLQAFLQNLIAHKDIANCLAVREFLCLDDPPGPFDSLEESRAFCETLEETNYRLQRELIEKQKELELLKTQLKEKQDYIVVLENRLKEVTLGDESHRRLSVQGSECSEVESSAVEADQVITEESNG